MTALESTRLRRLMERTSGTRDIVIALLDGPVARNHPDLAGARIQNLAGDHVGACARPTSGACAHGTFVAGILVGRRGSRAPSICPDCTMISRPIFQETIGNEQVLAASHEELARAVMECVDAGARVINLSVGTKPSTATHPRLRECLDYAARHSTLVVAAAGNHATLGSSAITRHPWVIPVVACDSHGRPIRASNLGDSIGRRGLRAPGEEVESLGVDGTPRTFAGTSVAAPFVTGAIALLWSEFPRASAAQIRRAVTHRLQRRVSVTPPLLDGNASLEYMGGMTMSGSLGDGTGIGWRAL